VNRAYRTKTDSGPYRRRPGLATARIASFDPLAPRAPGNPTPGCARVTFPHHAATETGCPEGGWPRRPFAVAPLLQAQALLNAPDITPRARAIFAALLGCALRRCAVAALADGRCSGGFALDWSGKKICKPMARSQAPCERPIDILRRYRSWIVGPTFAGLVVAVVVAFLWPPCRDNHPVPAPRRSSRSGCRHNDARTGSGLTLNV